VGVKRPAKLRRKKIGLALSGGAARGLAHIGVLVVLEKEGIRIDMIAGTSAGAAVGALYAQGKDASLIKNLAQDLSWRRLVSVTDLALPKTGFISGKKIRDFLALIIGSDIKFSDLKIPLSCVATDIVTGEEVIFDQGPVLAAIRASISIPAIFTAVKWQGRYLVDGGLVNPVPVDVVKQMGADFIIAVNVIPDVADRANWVDKKRTESFKEPNIIHIIMQSIYIGTYSLVSHSLEGANIVIEPRVAHIGAGDFHHTQECIRQGEVAAQDSIPEIKRQLNNL